MTSAAPKKEGVVPSDSSVVVPTGSANHIIPNSEEMMSGSVSQSAWTGNSVRKIKGSTQETPDSDELLKDGDITPPPKEDSAVAAATTNTVSNTSTAPNSSNESSGEEDVVDSALLSALRDPRERLALLKLEQVLIDFLEKQSDDPFIDVGGPYNSLVFSPSLGPIGDPSFLGGNSNSSTTTRPQTTFQRCILHRLCDRFRMTREKSYVSDGFGYYIRVVRGPDSTRPSRLLVDVPASEYVLPPSNVPVHDVPPSSMNGSASLTASFEQLGVTGSSADAVTSGTSNAPVPAKPSGSSSSKPKKMKIMKRSGSSNASSGGDNKNSSKNSGNNKQRNSLSEKERKYAEARARIFQQEESVSGDADASPFNDDTDSPVCRPTGNTSRTASNDSSRSSSPTLTQPREQAANSVANASEQTLNQGRKKATYRNRQQEEADPDFRRGVAVRVAAAPVVAASWNAGAVPYYPPTTTSQPVVGGRGYHPQKHSQQHQQYQQQLAQQYYAMPATHPGIVQNVVVMPGMGMGAMPQTQLQQVTTMGYPPRIAMATGSGIAAAGNGNVSGVSRYAANAPVDLTQSEQHFPALR
ncbi:SUZ domain RNA-binding domain protein [Nitzschia inconspicua]|uniref:SUZ domain RNA-binding domain protein n=1 Tax=Nitzschia inconspicua TaxID=303405 RepID=A0A9K3Q226_9STRA|nr:SUZ domain RNA-binding domain protein [Nitzschia inconspicua]